VQELALAKPLKHSKKFVVKSSGLSLAKKASIVGIGIAGMKKSSTSTGGSDTTHASMHALNLFDSDSSASSDESVSYPVSRKRKQSLHTCAQDVQITHTTTI
jgi:hypothetical protein